MSGSGQKFELSDIPKTIKIIITLSDNYLPIKVSFLSVPSTTTIATQQRGSGRRRWNVSMNDSIDRALDDLDDLDFNDSIVKVAP